VDKFLRKAPKRYKIIIKGRRTWNPCKTGVERNTKYFHQVNKTFYNINKKTM